MAQVFAIRALVAADVPLRGDLILQAVVGEEMMEHELGTTACVARGYRADGAVVAEAAPTGAPLSIAPATSGLLWCAISVEGRGTHAGMRSETIRPGGGVRGGSERNRHEYTTLECIAWHPPDERHEEVMAEVERQVAAAAALDPWLREHPPEFDWKHRWPASTVDVAHPLVGALAAAHTAATGREATVRGYPAVTDTTYLADGGTPAVVYGPGDLALAHAPDENVPIDELVTAALPERLVPAIVALA